MRSLSANEARTRYLDALCTSYATLRLPLHSGEHALPVQAMYQPLTLRHGPCSVEGQEEQRDVHVAVARTGSEALARSALRRMVVLGGPGMGKTTLLKVLIQQAIQQAHVDQQAPLPLFISLPDLARSELGLEVYLYGVLSALGIDKSYASVLEQAVWAGRAFVCLDSLDEVRPAHRPDIIALINREAIRCGGTWVIGSRFAEYKGGQFIHSQFSEWELQPLDWEMRLDLAHHLFATLSGLPHTMSSASAEDFVRDLEQDTRLAGWGGNPLLFSLTAIVYAQVGTLPGCRAALYRDVVASILAAREPDELRRAELLTLLAELALQLYQSGGRNFTVPELFELLARRAPDSSFEMRAALLARILDSGLLDMVASQTYGFLHQTFQEYLAAVALAGQFVSRSEAKRASAWEFAWQKRTYSRWSEVLRLCVGTLAWEEEGSQIAARWLRTLAAEHETADGDAGNLCMELALGSLREFSSALYTTELADTARLLVLAWIRIFLEHADSYLCTGRLFRLLEDIRLLDLHLALPALAWLEEVSDQEDDRSAESNRMRFLLLNISCNVPLPVKVLACAFPDSQGISLSASLLPATLQAHASQEAVVGLLEDASESWQVRVGAATLLGIWRDLALISPLCKALEETANHHEIRVAAARALREQGAQMPVPRLVPLLQDKDERIRLEVAATLSAAGPSVPLEPLLALLEDNEQIRLTVLSILMHMDGQEERASEAWLHMLADAHETRRAAALYLLGSHLPTEKLLAAVRDPHEDVRSAALYVAQKRGEQISLSLLLEILQDRAPEHVPSISHQIADMLSQTDRAVCGEFLRTLAVEYQMTGLAMYIARERHIPLPVDWLLELLGKQEYALTGDVAHLLADLGPQAPVATLLSILQDPSSPAHLGAAHTLALLAPHIAIEQEPIQLLLPERRACLRSGNERESRIYNDLVLCLVHSGISLPVEDLLDALMRGSVEYNEKDAVVLALRELGEQAPIETLLRMVPDNVSGSSWHDGGRALQVLRGLYEWITPQVLYRAAQQRVEDEQIALAVLEVLGQNAPLDLIKEVLDDEQRDRWLRSKARQVLHRAGVHLPLTYVLAETAPGQRGIDEEVVHSLRERGPQAPIEELLAILVAQDTRVQQPDSVQLLGENDDRVHETITEALRQLVPFLPMKTIGALLDHENPLARKGAARILGASGERAPIQKLIDLLRNPQEKRIVRMATLRTLAELSLYTPVETIVALLNDEDASIAGEALRSLREWGRDIPLEPLLTLIERPGDSLRAEAIHTLGWLQDRAPVDLLLALLKSENRSDSFSAALALGQLGKDAPLDLLCDQLYDEHGEIRAMVLHALASLGEYAPLSLILRAWESADLQVRQETEYVFHNLARALPATFVALTKENRHPGVRQALMGAIGRLGRDAPVEVALAAVEDENQQTRWRACEALLETGVAPDLVPIEPLLQALGSERGPHWTELELLATAGARVPVEPLLALLGSSDENALFVSALAAKVLSMTHPEVFAEVARQAEAILRGEPVGSIFASRVQSRVIHIVQCLGQATAAVLDMVSDLLDWPHWEVRLRAARALGTLHRNIPDRAIRRLRELRRDPESQAVRTAADEALVEILSRESGMEDA